MLLGPLYAIYVNAIDTNILAITWSTVANISADTIFAFIIPKVVDRRQNIKELLLLGYLTRAVAFSLFIFARNIESIILLQVLIGIGQGLGMPAFDTIFAEHLETGEHIADYSEWHLISNVVMVAGTFIGGFIVKYYGFDIIFVLMALLSLVSFFGIYFNRDL